MRDYRVRAAVTLYVEFYTKAEDEKDAERRAATAIEEMPSNELDSLAYGSVYTITEVNEEERE